MKIGIIGYGAMAQSLCRLLAAHAPQIQVVKVLIRSGSKAQTRLLPLGAEFAFTTEQLLTVHLDMVVECAGHAALKQVGQPRKPKEVADMFHIKTSDFTKAFKYVQEVLALAFQKGHLKGFSGSPSSLQTTRASHYIAHPLSRLPLKRSEFPVVLSLSTRLADIAEDLSLCSEHMPPSLAAASLAEAIKQRGHKDIPVETIAGLCDVSAGTLLKCWKRIEDTKKQWLPLLAPNTENK